MVRSRIRALALAGALVGWSGLVAPRLPPRIQVPLHAALGAVLVASTNAPLGLRPPELLRGVRSGLAVVGAVSTVVATSTTVPRVRIEMAEHEVPEAAGAWLLVRIPVGTVWPEEAAYRGALGHLAAQAFGPRLGRILQAATFGLSHVADARRADDSLLGTVVVTAVAGWLFGWLRDRSGSLATPMLAHLATNEAGAVAALLVRRRRVTG